MRLAIMQPYVFPYVGYFQLIASVDRFVIYDDVAYIKQGWINRNRILLNGKDHLFTLPLQDASPNKLIRNITLHPTLFKGWKEKFYRTLEAAYKKAPFYNEAAPLIHTILEKPAETISELAAQCIKTVCNYTGIATEFVITATGYDNAYLKGVDRVIDICKQEGALTYINAIGGRELYKKDVFNAEELELKFLQPTVHAYPQYAHPFVSGLSVVDLLMFNNNDQLREYFLDFKLID
ncbi:WbqC family protein [Flavisolibacter ginsenosidimutans]|uniref:WbqC family protein n=1 Tax=Flavisolibacter ginsenosidimutans TaxID=661481 RepID=A0A5B8UFJ5_9BACT|nr:WbqC family protein [Flavisolibacter ginsenosidimutans]QEC54870.1 WbqC family protein [Flavisolibacter ginsenosidimutans]